MNGATASENLMDSRTLPIDESRLAQLKQQVSEVEPVFYLGFIFRVGG